jgi:hypothetical protein
MNAMSVGAYLNRYIVKKYFLTKGSMADVIRERKPGTLHIYRIIHYLANETKKRKTEGFPY